LVPIDSMYFFSFLFTQDYIAAAKNKLPAVRWSDYWVHTYSQNR